MLESDSENSSTHPMTEDDDDIVGAVLGDTTNNYVGLNLLDVSKHSSAQRTKTALGHLDDFLLGSADSGGYWQVLRPHEDVPPDSSKRPYLQLAIPELDVELFGNFGHYLAMKVCNKTKLKKGIYEPIALNSAMGYFSSIRCFFKDHPDIRQLPRLPAVFQKENWTQLSQKLYKLIVERHKETGTPLVTPKAAATTDDWKALASICIWKEDSRLIEFWCVFVAMVHMAARVNEVANLRFDNLKTTELNGGRHTKNKVGLFDVNNYKQGTGQTMHVFPHIDLWQLDLFFSLAVFWAISDGTDDFIFPVFGEKSQKEVHNMKDSSQVVKHFTECLKSCVEWFDTNKECMVQEDDVLELPEELTDGICSHSGKKYAVREMGRELNPVYVIFRAGWAVRNAHTLFDYLVKDVLHDVKAAKICAGWHTKWYDEIWGGFNNSIDDLTCHREKFISFCEALFKYQHEKMTKEIMHLAGLSVLRFYKDFVHCVSHDPEGNNSILDNGQNFIQSVKVARDFAEVTEDVFEQWQVEVKLKFKEKNCYALSLRDAPADMAVDARPLLQRMQQLETVVLKTGEECSDLKSMVRELLRINRDQLQRICHLENAIESLRHSSVEPVLPAAPDRGGVGEDGREVEEQSDRIPTPYVGERRTTACYDDILMSRYGDRVIPVSKLFVSWFMDQLPVAYENYKLARKTDPRRKDKKYHTKVKNHFSVCKTAVHVVLKNLDAYPTKDRAPDDTHPMLSLEELANQALNRIKERHNLQKLPSRTQLAGKKDSLYKTKNYTDEVFPSGTPAIVEQFFRNRGLNSSTDTPALQRHEEEVDNE